MSAHPRDVCVTGFGLVSPLGLTEDDWWAALATAAWRGTADEERFRPFAVHSIGEIDLSAEIPKPGDQRAMGPMMQYGVHAAGVALAMAGIKGDEDLLLRTHLVVAAGGGERDWDLDEAILAEMAASNDRAALLNRQLADGLRPTLFLAQLPNLFAGNISIVHGVTGSSRTFMGEEAAGVDAVRIAFERIRAGQADIILVGASFNADRPDLHLMYHAGGILMHDARAPLWRRPDAGIDLGSAGAFLVLEARESAVARGAPPLARLDAVVNARSGRSGGVSAATAEAQWRAAVGADPPKAVLSGASGYGPPTRAEHDWLRAKAAAGIAVRGTAEAVGHAMEAAFLQNLVLAIMCVGRRAVFGPLSDDPVEAVRPDAPVDRVAVTAWGHLRGEGLAIVEAEDEQ